MIGAGPGGLAVATGAAAYGAKVILVDNLSPAEALGRGVLAVAAFAAAAREAQAMRDASRFGLAAHDPEVDFSAVMAGMRKLAADAAPAVSAERLATLGVTFIKAQARFLGRRRLLAGDTEIRARRYVLATGSTPVAPQVQGLDEVGHATPDTIFELTSLPDHLVVVGGDAAALELAQSFRRLGSRVTLLAEDNMLPAEDPEMAAVLARRLRAEGVTIVEGAKVTAVEKRGNVGVKLSTEGAGIGDIEGSQLLFSLGRTPDVAGLDLRKARVALKGDVVDVSAMLRTTNPRIYAIGELAGAPAQAAEHQAGLVLKALLFRLPAKDRAIVPRVIHTDPGLAHVGLTEVEASRRHRRLTILRAPYARNDCARAMRKTEGHIKLVVARDGKLLGVTIAGVNAADMIGAWTLALANGLGLHEIAASMLPPATTAEIGKTAAMSYFSGRASRPLLRGAARVLRIFG